MTLQDAEATRDALREKLEVARARLANLDVQRQSLAFEAHTAGGDAEQAQVELNSGRPCLVAEIETLQMAILEATRRVAAVEQEEELARLADNGAKALGIAARIEKRGRKLDKLLTEAVGEANDWQADINELHLLGLTHPHVTQFSALGSRALAAATQFSPLKIEFLAPSERRSFVDVAKTHVAMIERWAAQQVAQAAE